ncbi:MAG: cyclic nucleotide-binding domain-containing protein [Rhodocyclaceae bacterium]|nr:cyclic nucleotide-binding domain-containing protein [Rhodocyclaceae bacterium]
MSWVREQFTFQDLQKLLFKLAERVKAFQGLSPAEIGDVLAHAEKCTFEAGMAIVKEGNVGSHMYVIINGEASVTKKGRGGEVELARLGSADSFGEMALADNETRSASVSALTPCVLVRLNDQIVNSRPEIGVKIYRNISRVLSSRLRNADEALAWRL